MKIFLDSSKVEEVLHWGPVIKGVTTNPSIILKDGSNIFEFAKAVKDLPLSVEAAGDFITEARKYAKEIPNAVIKIPLLKPKKGDNLTVIAALVKEQIPVNCTALFNLPQVMLATKAGSRYVSVFAGRIDDEGGDYKAVITDCMDFLKEERLARHIQTELIVGSVRTVGNVLDCYYAGADIITITPAVLEKMISHKFSRYTVEEFEEAAEKLKVK